MASFQQKVVILGAGGACRAIVVALAQYVSEIVIYNRSQKDWVQELNQQLKCPITLKSLSDLESLKKIYRKVIY